MKIDTPVNWKSLFNPRSIAVIGASNTQGSWGYNAVRGLFDGKRRDIYPVNPNSPEIQGLKAYKSILDIPGPVELAVIVVAERLTADVLRECVQKGVKAAVVVSSGFSEMGERGQKMEKELVEIASEGNIRFIGPNTFGHADTSTKLSTFGQGGKMPKGPVAVLAQSGSTCLSIMRRLAESGIHCSKYISTGNEASLRMEDYLEYLAEDKNTRIIAAYIEGLRDGRRFFELAKSITREKPIVVVKVGGTKESARAVMSHTGALAGSDQVYTSAFRQSGVIRTEDDTEMCDVVYALLNSPLPHSKSVGIFTVGGGPGALAAEICEKEGLVIGQLQKSTVKKLDGLLSSRWPRRNPVDMAGPSAADFSLIAGILWPIIDDKNLDILFVLAPIVLDETVLVGRMGLNSREMKEYRKKEAANIRLIGEKIEKYGKPIVLMRHWRGTTNDPEIEGIFRNQGILSYSSTRRAARVMNHLAWYRHYLESTTGVVPDFRQK